MRCNERATTFYAHYRFANVFVDVKRAPLSLVQRITVIPGIIDAEANVVGDSQLLLPDVPEPLIAHLVGITPGRRAALEPAAYSTRQDDRIRCHARGDRR